MSRELHVDLNILRQRRGPGACRWQLKRKLADISADVEVLNHKVSRIRFDAASVAACEEGRPFSEAELQQLAGMKQRRMADLAWRQGTAILRAVMAHKVRAERLALLCLRR